jgi:hypothetical protein
MPVGLAHGKGFMRQKGRRAWVLEHPELTIKIEGKEDIVKAYLGGDSAEKIPDEVSFYYAGDPKKEIRLREESNPLWAALFLLLTPLLGAATLAYIEWHRRRQRGQRPSDTWQPTPIICRWPTCAVPVPIASVALRHPFALWRLHPFSERERLFA